MDRKSRTKTAKDYDYFIKVVLVGNSAVGKSSLMMRFADDEFKESYVNTIGVDFRFRTINVDGARVKIQIWDTAGQEKFRTITSTYYKGSDAVILVYDVTNEKSYKEIENYWVDEIKQYVDEISTFMIIGNKSDLEAKKVVDAEMASKIQIGKAQTLFFECSAKDNKNVMTAFEEMARLFIKKKQEKRKLRREATAGTGTQDAHRASRDDPEEKEDIYNLHMQLSAADAEKKKQGSGCSC